MSSFIFAVALSLVSADQPASTESEASDVASGLQSEGVQKAKFNEIERGFSIRLPIGMLAYLTPVRATNASPAFDKRYLPGLLIGAELAYDILPILDIGVFFYFANSQGVDTGVVRDLNTILGGVVVHLSFVHTERVYFGVKAGAGYGMQDTTVDSLQHGVGVIAALTLEYFTRIRHFSIAIDVGAMLWTAPLSVAITAIPAVRYTF